MTNIALVGCGFWSENHLKAWQRQPDVTLAALCDTDKGNLARRGEQFGVPPERRFTSAADLLSRANVNAVDIVTRPETHRELVEQASRAGKHVLCQKPFAPTMEDARAMVDAARAANIGLMVTENWRHLAPIQAIKRVLDAGTLGRVRAVCYRHKAYATPRMTPGAALDQPYFRQMPRFLFYEMGAHWFDTWRFLFGNPARLSAELRAISPHIAGEDSGLITLVHDDFVGHLDMSWASRENRGAAGGYVEEMVIEGEAATLILEPTGKTSSGRLILRGDDGGETIVDGETRYDPVTSLAAAQRHFLDCLATGAPFQTSGGDNLETLRLCLAVYESARTRQTVVVKDQP